jgi:hypothetical protein
VKNTQGTNLSRHSSNDATKAGTGTSILNDPSTELRLLVPIGSGAEPFFFSESINIELEKSGSRSAGGSKSGMMMSLMVGSAISGLVSIKSRPGK